MHEVDTVIIDIENGNLQRAILHPEAIEHEGLVEYNSKRLQLDHVPIIAPNGETIVKDMNFVLE